MQRNKESHQCLATSFSDPNLSVPNMVTFLMAKPSSSSKTPTKHIKTLAKRPSKNQRGILKCPNSKRKSSSKPLFLGFNMSISTGVSQKSTSGSAMSDPTSRQLSFDGKVDAPCKTHGWDSSFNPGQGTSVGIGIHFHTLWPWPAHRPRCHRCM